MEEMQLKVAQLHSALYQNGFSKKVGDLEADMREVKDDIKDVKKSMAVFIAGRETSCPLRKTAADKRREIFTIVGLCFSAISSVAVIITLIWRLAGC